jgi:hypothetical protein
MGSISHPSRFEGSQPVSSGLPKMPLRTRRSTEGQGGVPLLPTRPASVHEVGRRDHQASTVAASRCFRSGMHTRMARATTIGPVASKMKRSSPIDQVSTYNRSNLR